MGNIIVITGASSGMGREFAMQLDRGLSSVDEFWLVARRIDRMKEMAAKMRHQVKILPAVKRGIQGADRGRKDCARRMSRSISRR